MFTFAYLCLFVVAWKSHIFQKEITFLLFHRNFSSISNCFCLWCQCNKPFLFLTSIITIFFVFVRRFCCSNCCFCLIFLTYVSIYNKAYGIWIKPIIMSGNAFARVFIVLSTVPVYIFLFLIETIFCLVFLIL